MFAPEIEVIFEGLQKGQTLPVESFAKIDEALLKHPEQAEVRHFDAILAPVFSECEKYFSYGFSDIFPSFEDLREVSAVRQQSMEVAITLWVSFFRERSDLIKTDLLQRLANQAVSHEGEGTRRVTAMLLLGACAQMTPVHPEAMKIASATAQTLFAQEPEPSTRYRIGWDGEKIIQSPLGLTEGQSDALCAISTRLVCALATECPDAISDDLIASVIKVAARDRSGKFWDFALEAKAELIQNLPERTLAVARAVPGVVRYMPQEEARDTFLKMSLYESAQDCVRAIVKDHADLADEGLVEEAAKVATFAPNYGVQSHARQTLEVLVGAKPSLARHALQTIRKGLDEKTPQACEAALRNLPCLLKADPTLAVEIFEAIKPFVGCKTARLRCCVQWVLPPLLKADKALAAAVASENVSAVYDRDSQVRAGAQKTLGAIVRANPILKTRVLFQTFPGEEDESSDVQIAALRAQCSVAKFEKAAAEIAFANAQKSLFDEEFQERRLAGVQAFGVLVRRDRGLAKRALESVLRTSSDDDSWDRFHNVRQATLRLIAEADPTLKNEVLGALDEARHPKFLKRLAALAQVAP